MSIALLPLSTKKLQLRADESPRVPRLTLHHVPEQAHCIGAVVMIDTPVRDAICHRIEGQFTFEILRSRGWRRQHSLCRKLSLIETQELQIKIQMRLGVLDIRRNTRQNLRSLLLLARAAERDIEPVRAIDQAVIALRQRSRSVKGSCRLIKLA